MDIQGNDERRQCLLSMDIDIVENPTGTENPALVDADIVEPSDPVYLSLVSFYTILNRIM